MTLLDALGPGSAVGEGMRVTDGDPFCVSARQLDVNAERVFGVIEADISFELAAVLLFHVVPILH